MVMVKGAGRVLSLARRDFIHLPSAAAVEELFVPLIVTVTFLVRCEAVPQTGYGHAGLKDGVIAEESGGLDLGGKRGGGGK